MNVLLNYPDTVTFYETDIDEYGNEYTTDEHEVKAIIEQNTSYQHSGNQSAIGSSTVIRPDPSDDFIVDNYNRLEEMLVVVNPFADSDLKSWYRVIDVTVSRDTQFENLIDNVQCSLKKVSQPKNVS